jgi:cytochrome c-type biogenesis protein CcmE
MTADDAIREVLARARDALEVASGTTVDSIRDRVPQLRAWPVLAWAAASLGAAVWARERALRAKVVTGVLIVAGVLGFLTAGPRPEYYKHVDEVLANPAIWRRRILLVHGRIVAGSIEQARGTQRYRFSVQSAPPAPPATMRAAYTGALPDGFRPCAEVVMKGMLTDDDVLAVVPDGIMTRCPGKYDSAAGIRSDGRGSCGDGDAGVAPGAEMRQ